jgi:hypothetical protein
MVTKKEEKICKNCRYYQSEIGNPMWGTCGVGGYQASEKESMSGVSQRIIRGTRVKPKDVACEKFQSKWEISREEQMRERI